MNVTTEPYEITKLTFFRRAVPTRNRRLDTFEVWPAEQHKLNIVKTTVVATVGTYTSVGFVFDGVAYYLESESQFIPN